ncbi:hypothetical protein LCGC14_1255710 [marine sediment metagenome]|uniref:Uncharacterized protein n=1 Tax=marine sediment metagenome TaxID=412755 RepID=A0A0F9NIS7_9ZZZZ
MESPQGKSESPKQICSITVMFPVLSDDEAIAVKKRIGESVKDIADARIDFRITNLPHHGPPIR